MLPTHDAPQGHRQPGKRQKTILDYFPPRANHPLSPQSTLTHISTQGPTQTDAPAQTQDHAFIPQNTTLHPSAVPEQPPDHTGAIESNNLSTLPADEDVPQQQEEEHNTGINPYVQSRHRAQKRWCALLKRIYESGVGSRLTEYQWNEFKLYAKAYYYDGFLSVLQPQDEVLKCAGPIEGGQCPANMVVDFANTDALAQLEYLHIDHTYDINLICTTWLSLLSERPVSWHENVDVEILCHMLFSPRPLHVVNKNKSFAPGIQLRCHTEEHKCHATGKAHYN